MIIIDNAVNIRLGCTMPYNPPEPPEPPEPLYWCDWCEEPIFRGDKCRRIKADGRVFHNECYQEAAADLFDDLTDSFEAWNGTDKDWLPSKWKDLARRYVETD